RPEESIFNAPHSFLVALGELASGVPRFFVAPNQDDVDAVRRARTGTPNELGKAKKLLEIADSSDAWRKDRGTQCGRSSGLQGKVAGPSASIVGCGLQHS